MDIFVVSHALALAHSYETVSLNPVTKRSEEHTVSPLIDPILSPPTLSRICEASPIVSRCCSTIRVRRRDRLRHLWLWGSGHCRCQR
jgi:hypothetical protein